MQKITTFFMFDSGAGNAMDFYAAVFKNGKIISTIPGPDGKPMGGTFELDGQRFIAFNGGPQFKFSSGISLFVNAENQDEIDHYYEKLSDGGEKQPCGWLKDKFGVSWQVVPTRFNELFNSADPEVAGRVGQALFRMKKIIIADLEAAAAG